MLNTWSDQGTYLIEWMNLFCVLNENSVIEIFGGGMLSLFVIPPGRKTAINSTLANKCAIGLSLD